MISIVHFTNHPATIYSILYEKHVAADIKTKISFLLFFSSLHNVDGLRVCDNEDSLINENGKMSNFMCARAAML